jgi:zona occludens toxin (predicted ATPase)
VTVVVKGRESEAQKYTWLQPSGVYNTALKSQTKQRRDLWTNNSVTFLLEMMFVSFYTSDNHHMNTLYSILYTYHLTLDIVVVL